MKDLIYIGKLPCVYGFNPNSPYLILNGIEKLLKIRSFVKKSSIKSTDLWEEMYITIEEKKIFYSINEWSQAGNSLKADEQIKFPESITIKKIQSFPQLSQNKFVIPHSIETHTCNPEKNCPACGGTGICPDCYGERYVVCDVCGGYKECVSCNGSGMYPCHSCDETGTCSCCDGDGREDCDNCDGDGLVWEPVECYECNGTGEFKLRNGRYVTCKACNGKGTHHYKKEECEECGGYGQVTCSKCNGEGKCHRCSGEGHVECRACKGSGICGKCRGKGTIRCRACNASGRCPRCKGTGKVICDKCNGTGFYQSFNIIELSNSNTTKHILKDKKSEVLSAENCVKRIVYNETPYTIDFSTAIIHDTDLKNILCNKSSFMIKIKQYKDKLIDEHLDANGKPKPPYNKYIETQITIEISSVIKLHISYSNAEFIFYIIGEDKDVYCNNKPSLWNKFCAIFL